VHAFVMFVVRYFSASFFLFFFFFFQAEDGIRDRTVTGVQTCALPICRGGAALPFSSRARRAPSALLDTGTCSTPGRCSSSHCRHWPRDWGCEQTRSMRAISLMAPMR